jgi:hypothetical protein
MTVSGNCQVCIHAAIRKDRVILIHNLMILGFSCNAIIKKREMRKYLIKLSEKKGRNANKKIIPVSVHQPAVHLSVSEGSVRP